MIRLGGLDQTKVPFFCVDAVVEVPFGAAPHECFGVYEPMMRHMEAYVAKVNAKPVEGMPAYLERHVYEPKTWTDFLSLIGLDGLLRPPTRDAASTMTDSQPCTASEMLAI